MSRRYVVYFEPALENLDDMGNRMSGRLDAQIRDFLTAWQPDSAFEKRLSSHLWQFKWSPRQGSGARAFSGYFDGDDHDIALVLVTFKKKNEDAFYARQGPFNSRSEGFIENVFSTKTSDEIDSWLTAQRDTDSRKVLSEDDVSRNDSK